MIQPQRDRSLGDGVYFAPTDYIGISRRIMILCVDTVMLFVLGLALSLVWSHLFGDPQGELPPISQTPP